ncbi:MAG: hypothetical protein NTY87_02105 [Planctomycetia bacterium]|nr:hypothetical protein [Planctomycetia bacterium]RLT14324.1 MAG: hypothetical protein DWI25_05185 [Planctomycetota bacterium]
MESPPDRTPIIDAPAARSGGLTVPRPGGLVVVTIDRLPAWMLSAWGATWVSTPSLDSLAGRGLIFDRVILPVSEPLGILQSLLYDRAGASLFAHARALDWPATIVTDDLSIIESLAGRDSSMACVEVRHVEAVAKATVERDEKRTNLSRLFQAAGHLIESGGQRMVWCHAGSLGLSWDAPNSFRERYIDPEDPTPPAGAIVPQFSVDATTDPDLVVGSRQIFAGQLTLLDHQLGHLLLTVAEAEKKTGPWSVLVVGLRGLPLGLHGWVGCHDEFPPYSEAIHLPAILVDAGRRMSSQRYGGLVIPADLGETVAALLGGSVSPLCDQAEPWRGRSLMGLLESWSSVPRDRVIATGQGGAAVVTPDWHFVSSRTSAGVETASGLFAKPDDFFELCDVANRCPATQTIFAEALLSIRPDAPHAAWFAPFREGLCTAQGS